jgi:hypothetical protein
MSTTGALIRQLHRLAQPPSHQSCPGLFVTAGPRHRAVVVGTSSRAGLGEGAVPLPGPVRAGPDLPSPPHVAVDHRAPDAEPRGDGPGCIGASRWLRRRLTNTATPQAHRPAGVCVADQLETGHHLPRHVARCPGTSIPIGEPAVETRTADHLPGGGVRPVGIGSPTTAPRLWPSPRSATTPNSPPPSPPSAAPSRARSTFFSRFYDGLRYR